MLQLVHVVSPYVVADAIVARPQRRRRQNEFSYFLIAERKKENAFLFVFAMPPGSETRRLHLIHSTACFSLEA